MRALSSLADFSRPELERLLEWTQNPVADGPGAPQPLRGRVVGLLPLGPTALSPAAWAAAAGRLGAGVVRLEDLAGDPLDELGLAAEAARWCDLLVVSHPDCGFARAAAERTGRPVVNAGESSGEDVASGASLLATMRRKVPQPASLQVAVCGDLVGSRCAQALLGGLTALDAAVLLVPAQGCDLDEDLLARLAGRLGGRPARFAAQSMSSLLDMVDTVVLSHEESPQLPLFEEVDVPPGQNAMRVRRHLEELDFLFVAARGEETGRLVHAPFRSGRSLRVPDGALHLTRRPAVEAILRFAAAMDLEQTWTGEATGRMERYRAPEGLGCRGRRCVQRRLPDQVDPDFAVVAKQPWVLECLFCGQRTSAAFMGSRQEQRYHPVDHGVARSILPENRVLFFDEMQARDAGFDAPRRRVTSDDARPDGPESPSGLDELDDQNDVDDPGTTASTVTPVEQGEDA